MDILEIAREAIEALMPQNTTNEKYVKGAEALAAIRAARSALVAAEAREATQPTAAEVIKALRDALDDASGTIIALQREGDFGVNEGWSRDVMGMAVDDGINPALALCARWKEAK